MLAKEIAQATSLINKAYAKGIKNVRIAAEIVECTEKFLKENFDEIQEDDYFYYARLDGVNFVARKEK